MGIKNKTIILLNEHLENLSKLISCTDNSERKFNEQLQSEFRYFTEIKRCFAKNTSVPPTKIIILEEKLERYKKHNKYRYMIAKAVIDLNNSFEQEEVPF